MREWDYTVILDGPKANSIWNVGPQMTTFRLPKLQGKYRKVGVSLWPEFEGLDFNVGTMKQSNEKVVAELVFRCGVAFLQPHPSEAC